MHLSSKPKGFTKSSEHTLECVMAWPSCAPFVLRASAGGSFRFGLCGKISVGRGLRKLTPKQLGHEDRIDEDVRTETERVAHGSAEGDMVKVSCITISAGVYL